MAPPPSGDVSVGGVELPVDWLADRVQLLRIRLPALSMPPPVSAFPLAMVRPSRVTLVVLPVMSKTRLAELPLMVRLLAPGPAMIRFLLMDSSPSLKVMGPERPGWKMIAAPA